MHIVTNAANAAIPSAVASEPSARGARAAGGGARTARTASTVSVASRPIAIPQWRTTESGLLPRGTVAPPTATWATKIATSGPGAGPPPATRLPPRQPAMRTPISSRPSTSATSRCSHSQMTPPAKLGTSAPWQRGQSGQDIPASLIRTQLPRTAKAYARTALPTANARKVLTIGVIVSKQPSRRTRLLKLVSPGRRRGRRLGEPANERIDVGDRRADDDRVSARGKGPAGVRGRSDAALADDERAAPGDRCD